jgi:hypothetical protein
MPLLSLSIMEELHISDPRALLHTPLEFLLDLLSAKHVRDRVIKDKVESECVEKAHLEELARDEARRMEEAQALKARYGDIPITEDDPHG